MDALASLLRSDALPLAILGMIVLESVLLLGWYKKTGHGPRPALTISFLGAGFALMAALYFHRRDDGSTWGFALAMFAALLLHVWHVAQLARR